MDRQGFIDFNNRFSPEKSGKADSYARAIEILDSVLPYQDVIDLHGQSLYNISDIPVIEEVLQYVKDEVKKMKNHQQNIFDYGSQNQRSYPLGGFCTAALTSLIDYILFEGAENIVDVENNPKKISKRLIKLFDVSKDGEDVESQTKRRRGQEYFRRMILKNYESRCAITGINISPLILASHIIPWKDKTHKKERLNPCNGICLSALYDKAFDKGLIKISPDDYSVILSSALREYKTKEYYERHFGSINGMQITMPIEHEPNRDFLAYHRDNIFMGM